MVSFADDEQVPHAKPGKMCPLWKEDMSKRCHDCGLWVGQNWENPQTKQWSTRWHCAIITASLTNVDVTQSVQGLAAAVNDLRNETIKRAQSPPTWAVREIVKQAMVDQREEQLGLFERPLKMLGPVS